MKQLAEPRRGRGLRMRTHGRWQGDALPPKDRGTLDLVLVVTWLGALAGLLELGIVLVQRSMFTRISLDSLRTNRHFVWMIPAADILIFAVCGLVTAWPARRRPRLARRLACLLSVGLLSLSLLLTVEGLYLIASLVLSAGIAYQGASILEARLEPLRSLARSSLLPLVLGVFVLSGVGIYWVTSSERRSLSHLPGVSHPSPNVLLIVMDDVRAESLSLYGHDRSTTPRLEGLARQGVRFDAARSTAPWTLPSHASMFTGRWPHELSVGFTKGLDATYPTLAEYLAGHGYATAGFVANTYYCNARYGLDRGFARYEDFHENLTISPFEVVRSSSLGKRFLTLLGYSMRFAPGEKDSRKTAARINRDALTWLSERPPDRPFFLFLNYYDAHAPFIPPDDATRRFGLAALTHTEQVEILKRAHQASEPASNPNTSDAERARLARQAIEVHRDGYESSIAYLDEQIGRLFDELRRRGLLENTLVVVTSDHGEHFNEHGFKGHGLSLYRREIHVPLVIIPPSREGEAARHFVSEPVSLRDLPATVVDTLGLAAGSPFPGQSLAQLYRSEALAAPRATSLVLSEVEHQSNMPRIPGIPATLGSVKSITTDDHVYLFNEDGREELYNLAADPGEAHNLAAEPQSALPLERNRELLRRSSAHGVEALATDGHTVRAHDSEQ